MNKLQKTAAVVAVVALSMPWSSNLNLFNKDSMAMATPVPLEQEPLPTAADRTKYKVKKPIKVRAARNPSPARSMAYAKSQMKNWGWGKVQMKCLVELWMHESSWNHEADNPNSSAYGIPQALPASKMKVAGKDYLTNPVTQIDWGLKYIKVRYGTPCDALQHYDTKNWY